MADITGTVRNYTTGTDEALKHFGGSLAVARWILDLNEAGLDVIVTHEDEVGIWFDYGWFGAHVTGTTLERMRSALRQGDCTRCDGDGWIPVYQHVKAGICFRCKGSGIEPKRNR